MLVSGVLLGLLAGLAIGRDPGRLERLRLRWLPLLIGGVALRSAAPLVPAIGLPLYIAALGGTALAAALNARLIGAALIAAGVLMNLAVVLVNQGMPVDPAAVSLVGGRMPTDALHYALDRSSQLTALADIIPVQVFSGVYSAGDVVIAAGGFLLPFLVLARR